MCNIKKIILSISISFVMLGALIMGIYLNLNKSPKNDIVGKVYEGVEQTNQIYYAPNEISVQRGGNNLDYSYTPNTDLTETSQDSKTIAYEYIFTNTMDKTTGINLKDIDTTGVKVSYLYSNQPIDTEKSHTADTEFELRKLSADETLYVYIIVSPLDDATPATFNPNVVWYYGIPQTISVVNTATNTKETKTIINGQELDVLYEDVVVPNGYYFDSWFKDEECTKPITNNVGNAEATLHVRLANLPSDWLKLNGSEYYVKASNVALPENVVVPSYYNGKPVTKIYWKAFANNIIIKTIDLPSTIKTLDIQCFANCTQLTSIVMSKALEYVGSNAFNGCTSLKEVIFPDTVTEFGADGYQFYNCTSLTKVRLPKNLTALPAYMFLSCSNLAEVNIPKGITSIGGQAFYRCGSQLKLDLSDCKNLTTIGVSAFAEAGITELDLTGCTGLTEIKDTAFIRCASLTKIEGLGTCVNLSSLGTQVFNNCTSLISIGDISKLTKLKTLPTYTFYNCGLVGTITLPVNLTEISTFVFNNCNEITEIIMPNSVTSIGISAFHNCTGLTKVNISNKVTVIPDSLFNNARKLLTINIPAGVTSIGYRAFFNCYELASADLSKCTNLTSIGQGAFQQCYVLTTVGDLGKHTNLTEIPQEVFYQCYELTDIGDLSKLTKLKTIGAQAFIDCSALTGNCVIPASVTKIGQRAFRRAGWTTITFANTSGWWVTTSTDYTGGTELTSADLVANSTTYLKTTYYTYYWHK